MVAVNFPLGFHGPNFFPEQSGRDYELSDYLKPAAALRNDFTIVSGTSHPDADGGTRPRNPFSRLLRTLDHAVSRTPSRSISSWLDGWVGQPGMLRLPSAIMACPGPPMAWPFLMKVRRPPYSQSSFSVELREVAARRFICRMVAAYWTPC